MELKHYITEISNRTNTKKRGEYSQIGNVKNSLNVMQTYNVFYQDIKTNYNPKNYKSIPNHYKRLGRVEVFKPSNILLGTQSR